MVQEADSGIYYARRHVNGTLMGGWMATGDAVRLLLCWDALPASQNPITRFREDPQIPMLHFLGFYLFMPILDNMPSKLQAVQHLARSQGILRARDLHAAGLPTVYLGRLVKARKLIRQGRGLYAPADREVTEKHDWELACSQVPEGVLCLTTALTIHGIGTQSPRKVWMAIDRKAWAPKIKYPPLRFVRFGENARKFGVQTLKGTVVAVRVYDPAKTVADCFKYRHKIGIDVAVEALRDGWRMRKFSLAQLVAAAAVCRVSRVMQPYLEMLP